MTFLRNSDVMDFILTDHGKSEMAKGKFSVEKVSFSDNEILYDGIYGGVQEEVKDIDNRIKATPTLAAFNSSLSKSHETFSKFVDRDYGKMLILGESESNLQKTPYWKLTMNDSHINSVSDDSSEVRNYPILDVSSEYAIVDVSEGVNDDLEEFYEFEDGSQIGVTESPITVSVSEGNVGQSFEQFELEIYEVSENGVMTEVRFGDEESKSVEFYFELEFDSDIEDSEEAKPYTPRDIYITGGGKVDVC